MHSNIFKSSARKQINKSLISQRDKNINFAFFSCIELQAFSLLEKYFLLLHHLKYCILGIIWQNNTKISHCKGSL